LQAHGAVKPTRIQKLPMQRIQPICVLGGKTSRTLSKFTDFVVSVSLYSMMAWLD
jgi:hypothetical protein